MNAAVTVIFAFCFAGAFAGTIDRKSGSDISKICLQDYGIDFENTDTPLTDEQVYCIPACAYRSMEIMGSDGTIDTKKAEKFFEPEDAEERAIFFSVHDACHEGRTHCKLVQCMFNELKNHWKSSKKSKKVTKQLFSQLA